ncbi:hypothetical protein ACO0R3_000971 [Hanseniaspora guilliermondii]
MNKISKLITSLFILLLVFVGSLEVVSKGCNQLKAHDYFKSGNYYIDNVCQNKQLKNLYEDYSLNTIISNANLLVDDIKSYPYKDTLQSFKYKSERFILTFNFKETVSHIKDDIFDFKNFYIKLKTYLWINYQQLKNFIFLKYQILILNREQWKHRFAEKTADSDEVAITDVKNIKKVLEHVTKDKQTELENDNVPVVTNTKHEVADHPNYGVISFEESFKTVDEMSYKMIKAMKDQMENLETAKISEMKPLYVEKIKKINQLANERMAELSTMIREINNCDLVEDKYYYNKTNSECEYAPISRESFRKYFNETKEMLQEKSKRLVEVDYSSDLKDLASKLEELKLLYVDTFEDWGDTTIEKLKGILTYENIAQGSQEEQEMLLQWQKLTSLKNEIIKKRDSLVDLQLEFKAMQEFVDELKKNIGVLAHEGGDRLYIIRAKANLEFQDREKPSV